MPKIKTCINEMSLMIKTSMDMVNSFKYNELAYNAEDLVYKNEINNIVNEIKSELIKAKKIKHGK